MGLPKRRRKLLRSQPRKPQRNPLKKLLLKRKLSGETLVLKGKLERSLLKNLLRSHQRRLLKSQLKNHLKNLKNNFFLEIDLYCSKIIFCKKNFRKKKKKKKKKS